MAFDDWAADEIELLVSGTLPRKPSSHTSLFKYIGLNTKTSWDALERTLKQCELTGSTARSLNDPFELSPHIFDDLRPTLVAAAIGDTGMPETLSDRDFRPDEKYADLAPFRASANAYLEKVMRYSRVISFCERSDSPLLWSHYAHSYEGACLHFLGRAFARPEVKLGYVNYSTYRPAYPLSLALYLHASEVKSSGSRYFRRLAESEKLYFFTKASDWAYENEVRIVYNANRLRSVPFDQDGLVSIIPGPRMSNKSKERLAYIVESSRFPNLPIRQASLSTNSFSVEIR